MFAVFMGKLVRFFAFLDKRLALLAFIFFASRSLNLQDGPILPFSRRHKQASSIELHALFLDFSAMRRRLFGRTWGQ